MNISFNEDRLPDGDTIAYMNKASEHVLAEEGIDACLIEVSVTFADPECIRELNRIHRGIDAVTDVLSFPQYENPAGIIHEAEAADRPVALGDVVICKDRVAEQAESLGHSFEYELLYMFVHSLLHLLGHDHESDEGHATMRKTEIRMMDSIGLGKS